MADGSKVRVVITRHLVRPAKTDRGHVALYNAADAMIFVSETALMAFMSTSPAVDRSRLFVVPPAVAAGAPECAESRSDGEFRIVFVGRLHPEKGIDKLLEAFVGLPDFAMLHIVGSGTPRYEEEYRRMAFTLGISGRVVWHGHVADPLPLMASAHVGVLPSVQLNRLASPCSSSCSAECLWLQVPVAAPPKSLPTAPMVFLFRLTMPPNCTKLCRACARRRQNVPLWGPMPRERPPENIHTRGLPTGYSKYTVGIPMSPRADCRRN